MAIINDYPTMETVESADHLMLAMWWRFLPSPGMGAIGDPDFEDVLKREKAVMDRIAMRLEELGGMTPSISKRIGW